MQPAGSNDEHNSPTIVSLAVCQGQVQPLAGPAGPACRDLLSAGCLPPPATKTDAWLQYWVCLSGALQGRLVS